MNEPEKFLFFYRSDDEKPFSNWYLSNFTERNISFNCVEQYLNYHKALLFGDYEIAIKVLQTINPFEQKKLGRMIKNYSVDEWNRNCRKIILKGNRLKFQQNQTLYDKLIATQGYTLVEASENDKILGVGLSEDNPDIQDKTKWLGKNLLGYTLSSLRESFILKQEIDI